MWRSLTTHCERIIIFLPSEIDDAVMSIFTETRQTMLFSATQTKKTEDLARISLKKRPVYIDVEEFEQHSTVSGLQQVNSRTCICHFCATKKAKSAGTVH